MEQAREPHHCCQHKVLCSDVEFLASHEKISNPKREASIAPALTVCVLPFLDKLQISSVKSTSVYRESTLLKTPESIRLCKYKVIVSVEFVVSLMQVYV